jgi:hypothetical protein
MKTTLFISLLAAATLVGCVTKSVTTVTPGVNGGSPTTNQVTVVNQANLDLDCAALQLVGTPALIYALNKDPQARPIVVDIQTALTGALVGADTNVVAQINGLIGGDPALQASLVPLIQAASSLNQQMLAKYGTVNGVIISEAILKTDLLIVNSALAAVPAK